jgi:hypothetical protein
LRWNIKKVIIVEVKKANKDSLYKREENEEGVPPRWVKIYKKEVSRGGKHFLLRGTF